MTSFTTRSWTPVYTTGPLEKKDPRWTLPPGTLSFCIEPRTQGPSFVRNHGSRPLPLGHHKGPSEVSSSEALVTEERFLSGMIHDP